MTTKPITLVSSPDRKAFGPRLFVWLSAFFFAAFLLWAAVSPLDIVSTASGEVIPSTKVKSIQHLEGGIVGDILVQEGDRVAAGQELIILEETAQGSTVEELDVRLASLQSDVVRLKAEEKGEAVPVFGEDFEKAQPKLVAEAKRLFSGRRERLEGEKAAKRESVIQREQDVREIKARIKNNKTSLELVREQVAISEELLKDSLTTKYKHLSFLKEESQLKSKLEEDKAALSRAQSELAEAREKLKSLDKAFRAKAGEELKDAARELEELSRRRVKFSDTLSRTVIRSPVEGVIKTLYIVTKGGVIQPGQVVLDIVPVEDRLVVETHLPVADRGYVREGQVALVGLASRDAGRYGKIKGKVVHVSPDTISVQGQGAFYAVRIETDEDSFSGGGFTYDLVPGMLVTAHIHTGKRTVLGYILSPFTASMDGAFLER